MFQNCISLQEITIPDNIRVIESNTFNGCSNLTTITLSSDSHLERISPDAFTGTNITTIRVVTDLEIEDPQAIKNRVLDKLPQIYSGYDKNDAKIKIIISVKRPTSDNTTSYDEFSPSRKKRRI